MRVYYESNFHEHREYPNRKLRRFGVVDFTNKEEAFGEEVVSKLYEQGWNYDGFGDSDSTQCYFKVDDREEYEYFLEDYKEAKKEVRKEMRRKNKYGTQHSALHVPCKNKETGNH